MARVPSGDKARSFVANGTDAWKYIGRGWRLLACHKVVVMANASRRNVEAANQPARSQVLFRGWSLAVAAACELVSLAHFSSLARSLALCHRSSGSLPRHF